MAAKGRSMFRWLLPLWVLLCAPALAGVEGAAEELRARALVSKWSGEAGPIPLDQQREAHGLVLALTAPRPGPFEQAIARDGLALELASLLDQRVLAPWTAQGRAHLLARLGRVGEAEAVLSDALARFPRDGELWNQRALVWLGAGDRDRGREYLGAALRRGYAPARLSLARLDWDRAGGPQGRPLVAFRAAIRWPEPPDWARYGWGIALVESRAGRIPLE